MARITVEDCLQNVNNRFILVHMAEKRTRQLLKGTPSLVNAPDNRYIVRALREIAARQVNLEQETLDGLYEGGFLAVEED